MNFSGIYGLISMLSPFMPLLVVMTIFTALGILGYVFLIVRSARKKEEKEEKAAEKELVLDEKKEDKPQPAPSFIKYDTDPSLLAKSFAEALSLLKSHVPGRDYQYEVPWYLLLGEHGSGKTTVLNNLDIHLPMGRPFKEGFENREGCNWWFYDNGVVLDVEGDYVLHSNGKSSFDKGWKALLGLLEKHRPERPLDGVILTISCEDLIGPQSERDKRLAATTEKAKYLFNKLWNLQRSTGIFFPVYIMVTKCDLIRGFKGFVNEIPPQHRDDVFGWSNPNSLEVGYSPELAEDAFKSIFMDLYQTQIELISDGIQNREPDDFFLFPTEFQAVAESLRIYLNHLFRKSVYHESFFFRGIYFTGDTTPDEKILEIKAPMEPEEALDDGPPLGPPTSKLAGKKPDAPLVEPVPLIWLEKGKDQWKKPCFLKHLFEKKIFAEYALARPVAQNFMALNRRIITAQVIMVLIVLGGGLGLWSKYDTLQDNKRSLMPVLKGIRQDLNEIRHEENRWSESEKSFFYDSAVNLLEGMTNINTNSLVSLLYPSSWVDSVNDDIRQAMTLAYNKIILKSMLFGLQQKTEGLLARLESYEKAPLLASPNVAALEQIPEFIELRQSLDEFKAIQTHGDLYNKLRNSHELHSLSEVIFYLFGVRLPPGFFQNAFFYHKTLRETDYILFQPEVYRDKAVPRIKQLFHRFYTKLFHDSSLERQLQELVVQIEQLESGRSWSPETGLREFEKTAALISQQQELLANPEFAWLFRDKMSLGAEFDKILETVEKSGMLGRNLRVELEMTGEKSFQVFKKAIAAKETSLTGPIISRENEKLRTELSPGVFAVKTSFDKLLGQKFVNLGLPYKPLVTEIPSGSRIVWDKKLLEEAASLSQQYEMFIREGFKGLSPNLQKLMTRVARARLEQTMLDLIAHAQNYKIMPKGAVFARLDADIGPDVLNFREALKQLGDIIDIFNQMDFIDSSWQLSNMLTSQAANLLKTVDRLLEDEKLYEFKDGAFRWGNGVTQASLTAFEARDARELEYYLAIQRERIKHMARDYAEPLVRFLVDRTVIRGSGIEAITTKWQRIFLEIDRYEAQKAGNSPMILEKFILFDMDKMTPVNRCNDVTMKDMGDPSGDFFLQKLARLRQMAYKQCAMRITNEALKEYTAVATFFNEKLAGKFPFSEVSDDGAFLEAKPENVQEFFWLLDNYLKTGKPLLEKTTEFGLSGDKALEFVNKLEKVRGFFSPFLEKGKESNLPVYLLDVDFRVNRKVEVGANQIIDWNLDVGQQRYNLLDAKRSLRWSYGDPITFSVRWAKDSPYQPIQYTTARARVEDRSVLYQYTNRWSLISLLRNHESNPEDFERLIDPKPNTIKFVIGTVAEDKISKISRVPPEKTPEINQSKVFVRVTVMTPEKSDVKVLPEFPAKAPPLAMDLRGRPGE